MGFLANLAISAGRNILVGQDMQDRQADIDLKKQQLQMGQMAMQQKQQQVQTQQAVGSFIASEEAKDSSTVTDPYKSAQTFEKASAMALRSGDFVTANQMGELAKGKLNEAKENAAVVAQQQQVKKEALADAASTYVSGGGAEAAKDLMQKAVAAGVNPSTIPMPGTPQFGKWANDQTLASKTAAQRADFVQKYAEMDENRREKQAEHADNVALRQQGQQQTAMLREAMLGIQKGNLEVRREELKLRQDSAASGGKQGVQQQRDTAAIAGAAAEGARNLRNITSFNLGTTSSPFNNLSDHGILDAVAKGGTNAFTPETVQMFQTAGAGLATQVGRVETLGGGRGVNQAQINQLEKQLTPTAGDHPVTQLYKVSTGAELLLTRMQNTPPPRDPTMKAQWDKTMTELSSYPKPEDILKVSKGETKKELLSFDRSYAQNLDRVRSDVSSHPADTGLPGGADAGAGTSAPPIPAGWSVKAH